jgi:hypothetical protein
MHGHLSGGARWHGRMPRFFFHLYDDVVSKDEEGRELPDLESARAGAIREAREIACEQIKEGKLSLHHRIEVVDEDDRQVFTLPFRSAFKIEE